MSTDVTDELTRLGTCGTVLAVKVYRVEIDPTRVRVPVLPCLDHEAMLHQHVDPHLSAYLLEPHHQEIHEVGVYPTRRTLKIDTVSTLGEFSGASTTGLRASLDRAFPGFTVKTLTPSWWRGEHRVAEACRAQITLRDVLLGEPSEALKRRIDKLQMVGALMEKQSRVASWGVRTITGPLLAGAGVVLYAILGAVAPTVGLTRVTELQYAIIGTLGATFLYYGLKAVQLTDMGNRVWKRATEYSLVLTERKRLAADTPKS
jgi:hypothetical protein